DQVDSRQEDSQQHGRYPGPGGMPAFEQPTDVHTAPGATRVEYLEWMWAASPLSQADQHRDDLPSGRGPARDKTEMPHTNPTRHRGECVPRWRAGLVSSGAASGISAPGASEPTAALPVGQPEVNAGSACHPDPPASPVAGSGYRSDPRSGCRTLPDHTH